MRLLRYQNLSQVAAQAARLSKLPEGMAVEITPAQTEALAAKIVTETASPASPASPAWPSYVPKLKAWEDKLCEPVLTAWEKKKLEGGGW